MKAIASWRTGWMMPTQQPKYIDFVIDPAAATGHDPILAEAINVSADRCQTAGSITIRERT
jgi:hypothetical protein